ncbi:beta-galactosidase GalA [Fimbriimonas ginsengisoli]|nr:beta-galactosidase GalA [Fimbriimonas ginsengisoli]
MALCLLAPHTISWQATTPPRERLLMDKGWRFALGHATDPSKDFDPAPPGTVFSYFAKAGTAQGAARDRFDDSKWRSLDLPHDWAVELPFDSLGSNSHGSKAIGKNFPENSVGWYRKTFDVPAADRGRRIALDFDGVFRDSQVWVNGFYLGRATSGYTSFGYDVSDYLNYGGRNTVAVRVDASLEEGWFYEGAGIYRHVWLTKTAPVHVARSGTFVTTSVGGRGSSVDVRTTVQNDADAPARFEIGQTITDPEGRPVATWASKTISIGPGGRVETPSTLRLGHVRLWSVETPTLYRLVTTVRQDKREVDRYETPFGVRTIRWDASKGFILNGKRVQLKGVCDHQDHAGVGVAVPDALEEWRLKQLKKMGVNALRTSHNAPNPALLDACDRLGILVMDENRETGINPQQLESLGRMITRDRNHPSVVIWSIGNEEWSIEGNDKGARVTSTMQAYAKSLDPTRPTTVAISGGWGAGSSTTIDVMGFNYFTHGNTDDYHAKFPNRPSVGTEDGATLSTRGVYVSEPPKGWLSAYDVNGPDWASTAHRSVNHYAVRPFVAGQFQWTGFDYRGEPTPFGWPNIASQFGILDLCGFPKDNFYYYRAWWSDAPSLHLFPHWNWPGKEGQPIDVWVHGNVAEVELTLNGTSLGRKPMPRFGHLEWKVPYSPGVLLAKGYSDGKEVLSDRVETTGEAEGLRLGSDQASIKGDGEDLAVVAVSAADAGGRAVSTAGAQVTFEISGPGRIIGVGNGNPSSHEPDQAVGGVWRRVLFNGLAQVIVQSTGGPGEIVLTAKSGGLKPATLRIKAAPTPRRPFVP